MEPCPTCENTVNETVVKYCGSEMEAACMMCAAPFTRTCSSRVKNTCSKSCSVKYGRKKNAEEIPCARCGEMFAKQSPTAKYCNKEISVECIGCDNTFQRLCSGARGSYCSTSCRNIHMRATKYHLAGQNCKLCGDTFAPTSNKQIYCENPHMTTCIKCEEPFAMNLARVGRENGNKYCGNVCSSLQNTDMPAHKVTEYKNITSWTESFEVRTGSKPTKKDITSYFGVKSASRYILAKLPYLSVVSCRRCREVVTEPGMKYCNKDETMNCPGCNTDYIAQCSGKMAKYCSTVCARKVATERLNGDPTRFEKICEICQTIFTTNYGTQKFCTNPHTRECAMCGEDFSLIKKADGMYQPERICCDGTCVGLHKAESLIIKSKIPEYKKANKWAIKYADEHNGEKPTREQFCEYFGIKKFPYHSSTINRSLFETKTPESRWELIVTDFLDKTYPEVRYERNFRRKIQELGRMREIDIYFPDLHAGIEIQDYRTHDKERDDVVWNPRKNDANRFKKGPTYHEEKRRVFLEEFGITVFEVWEDDIRNRTFEDQIGRILGSL